MTPRGAELLAGCKRHVIETMRGMPECRPDGSGAGNKDIEEAAGFRLDLPIQDGWFTWSLLTRMALDGDVDVIQRAPRARRRYRLKG
jgi:hypothetical protein